MEHSAAEANADSAIGMHIFAQIRVAARSRARAPLDFAKWEKNLFMAVSGCEFRSLKLALQAVQGRHHLQF